MPAKVCGVVDREALGSSAGIILIGTACYAHCLMHIFANETEEYDT